jgi:broad specificity phosphatase PhoE
MRVYFATHATTTDNEAGMASGWRDARLSRSGIQQAEQLGHRFEDKKLDLICCSDLTRAADTVRLAFDDRLPVIVDRRLKRSITATSMAHPSRWWTRYDRQVWRSLFLMEKAINRQ